MKRLVLGLLAAFVVGTLHDSTAQQRMDVSWNWSNDDRRLSVDIEGEITFGDDDRSVTRMSRGAHIRVRGEEGGRDWRLFVERVNGEIMYDYRRDGERIPFNQARDDIGDVILMIIRETGINAEARVARILRTHGPTGVFAEVEAIRSSGSSARYLLELAEQAELNESQLRRFAELTVEDIHSSGSRSRVLIGTVDEFADQPDAMQYWLKAAASIPSSGDKSRALMKALDYGVPESSMEELLELVAGISSSGDKSRVLIGALNEKLSPTETAALLRTARTISSSGDKARVLIASTKYFQNTDAVRDGFFDTAQAISSSGDRARVLLALMNGAELDDASMVRLLGVASSISSSGDKSRVLIAAVEHIDGETMEEAFLNAAETISSSGDKGRVLMALVRNS